jgi:hypothetical protein
MKGISLPINVIIVVAVAALVFAVIGFFFLTSTGGQISRTDAQAIFNDGCLTLCNDPCESSGILSRFGKGKRTELHTKFIKACVALGYAPNETMDMYDADACLAACGSCTVDCVFSELELPEI